MGRIKQFPANSLHDLSLICLLAVRFGARHGARLLGALEPAGSPGAARLMNALCLLIFTQSLITANWEGQFKQAQRSSCAERAVGAKQRRGGRAAPAPVARAPRPRRAGMDGASRGEGGGFQGLRG